MRAKIKKGASLLFCGKWDKIQDSIIINFMAKHTYKAFKQAKNHLLIDTEEGEIDIVFTGETPKLEFYSYCKDQLILKIT